MILFISPAKTFRKTNVTSISQPPFLDEMKPLLTKLKSLSVKTLENKMKISKKVAETTYNYYQNFNMNQSPAIFTYFGHQYKHINPDNFTADEVTFLNNHLYIMDGLYGLLRPLDLISFYRLEMQDKTIRNLYKYWTPIIKNYLDKHHSDEIFINLASNEYGQIICDLDNTYTIEFYQRKNNKLTIHSMEAKKLRGLMVHHIIKHHILSLDDIYKIQLEGYTYHEENSNKNTLIFIKEF